MSTPLPITSAPASRALTAQGIATLEQLSTYPEAYVASLHGVGPKVIRILKAALAEAGLGFSRADAGVRAAIGARTDAARTDRARTDAARAGVRA